MNIALDSLNRIGVFYPSSSSFKQQLAAREFVRGMVQLGYRGTCSTSELPGDVQPGELKVTLLSRRSSGEAYTLSVSADTTVTLTIEGEGDSALLYGVFDFLEQQGAYFGVDGDLYPLEKPTSLILPDPSHPWERHPRFATRGLLPWPDFLNCISVYNREDFRAYLEAMLRMRFNTLGVHVYGQSAKWAESFLSFEYGGVSHNAFTDTTATDRWGYLPQRTSRYGMSAAQYYDGEVFGANATRRARSPWEAAELAQALWRDAFTYAEQLGIRVGVGFEPYQVPDEIYRAVPPETRIKTVYVMPPNQREVCINRIDPESKAAKYVLEARLAQLLEAYPSVSYVYLWEDEMMSWASQTAEVELPVTPFKQAHDFLRRHAPDKRLVLAGWGGVARHFLTLHRALPEDVIFTALSDQLGWDPIHKAFSQLDDRERWPIPWIEDDASMWFPQLHAHRFQKDITLAEQYGCQGMLGIHWRHRIIDPVAGYMARRFWDASYQVQTHYQSYARTQACSERVNAFGEWLEGVDSGRKFLSTWTGEIRPDGHARTQSFSGDYDEGFEIEHDFDIDDAFIASQAHTLNTLKLLVEAACSPIERERLSYWYGQSKFLDPYARAWQIGRKLHRLIIAQQEAKKGGDGDGAVATMRAEGVPLWIDLLAYTREAVLAFQHTVATRGDLGMLASLHNKFVRIATFRLGESLREFLDELPSEAEEARRSALASDSAIEANVIVPTRPTRLSLGECVTINAVAPGTRELIELALCWRPIGTTSWRSYPMTLVGRRTYSAELTLPDGVIHGIEYKVRGVFAGMPAPLVVSAPPEGAYLLTL